MAYVRVEHFAIFGKLVFTITSKLSRISKEDIDSICSLKSGLQFSSISPVGILSLFEVIGKTSFSKIVKCATLAHAPKTLDSRVPWE